MLHRPWRFLALLAIVIYVMGWTAFRHRQETIDIVRRRRHRLANQLQLVGGWLQLGAIAKAEESLAAILESEIAQTQWFRGLPSYWSYLFLRWDARAEDRAVAIRWEGLNDFFPSYRMSWMLDRRLREAMAITEMLMIVQLGEYRFRIRVDETPPHVPKGWVLTPNGVEVSWRGRREVTRAGPSARM